MEQTFSFSLRYARFIPCLCGSGASHYIALLGRKVGWKCLVYVFWIANVNFADCKGDAPLLFPSNVNTNCMADIQALGIRRLYRTDVPLHRESPGVLSVCHQFSLYIAVLLKTTNPRRGGSPTSIFSCHLHNRESVFPHYQQACPTVWGVATHMCLVERAHCAFMQCRWRCPSISWRHQRHMNASGKWQTLPVARGDRLQHGKTWGEVRWLDPLACPQ